MPSARIGEDIKLFIPQDVKDMTTRHSPNVVFPAANYGLYGCRACSVLDGVVINNVAKVCTQCKRDTEQQFQEYQHAEMVAVGTPTATSLIVGTECKFCPAGYEYYNREKKSEKVPCRSMTGVLDCC